MFFDIFRGSLSSKLENLLRASYAEKFQCGRQIHCHISPRPKNFFGFSAAIATNDAHRGDVNGNCNFFASKDYSSFREALVSLTAEVAKASSVMPEFQFFRVFGFGSKADVQYYLLHNKDLSDGDGWLERAILCDWRERNHFVSEKFESGSWTQVFTEGSEVLDLMTDEIRPLNIWK